MAYKPIRMNTIEKINQYRQQGMGIKRIARILTISKNTVRSYLAKLETLDSLAKQPIDHLDEHHLYSEHFMVHNSRKQALLDLMPEYFARLRLTGVTREMVYQDYIEQHPKGYSYGEFCRKIKSFKAVQNATLQLEHKPGHTMQADFAGKCLKYYDLQAGEMLEAQVFIATLPCSGLTFVMALPNQNQTGLVKAINEALLYFGGVPQVLLSDNMRTYVTKADRYEPTFNQLAGQLAAHYAIELDGTRVAKPKDKGHVERHVTIAYQNIHAHLHGKKFYSIDQLNIAIRHYLDELNDKVRQGDKLSRRQQFEQYEKPLLKPLPPNIFEPSKSTMATVQRNYHVLLGQDKHYYSVPYQYIGCKTEIIYTSSTVEIYIDCQRIALHQRCLKANGFSTLDSHRPEKHNKYLEQLSWDSSALLDKASLIGIHTTWAIKHIIDQQPIFSQAQKSCLGIFALHRTYGTDRLEKTCAALRPHNTVNYTIVKNILSLNETIPNSPKQDDLIIPDHENIRGANYYA